MITLALLALAAKPAPPPVPPTGPWVVRSEENLCLLARNYVVDGRTQSLIFQPLLDLDEMEMFVVAPGTSGTPHDGKFTATVDSRQATYTGRYYSAVSAKAKGRVTRLYAERKILDELKDGDVLRIQAKPLDQAFALVRPERARAALRTCVEGLKKDWGIDPDSSARAVTPLEGNPGRFFSAANYPPEAYQKGIYGRVVALLNIDPTGRVSNCRIVSSAGEALNAGTCQVARRVRFKPARDKDGTALASTYLLPVKWTLPGAPDF